MAFLVYPIHTALLYWCHTMMARCSIAAWFQSLFRVGACKNSRGWPENAAVAENGKVQYVSSQEWVEFKQPFYALPSSIKI